MIYTEGMVPIHVLTDAELDEVVAERMKHERWQTNQHVEQLRASYKKRLDAMRASRNRHKRDADLWKRRATRADR